MKRIALCAIVAAISLPLLAGDSMTMTGWVHDAKCAAAGKKPDPKCVKACNDAGTKLVFVDDKEQKVLQVANQDSLKGHPGEHVQITATKTSDGALQIAEVKALPAPAGAPAKK